MKKAPESLIAQAIGDKLNRDTRPGTQRGPSGDAQKLGTAATRFVCAVSGPLPWEQGIYFSTASLNAFAGRRRTTVVALILMASPV